MSPVYANTAAKHIYLILYRSMFTISYLYHSTCLIGTPPSNLRIQYYGDMLWNVLKVITTYEWPYESKFNSIQIVMPICQPKDVNTIFFKKNHIQLANIGMYKL